MRLLAALSLLLCACSRATPGFAVYTDREGWFSMEVPGHFRVVEMPDPGYRVSLHGPRGVSMAVLHYPKAAADEAGLRAFFAARGLGLRPLGLPAPVSAGGAAGLSRVVRKTGLRLKADAALETVQERQVALPLRDGVLLLTVSAPSALYEQADAVFSHALATLRLKTR